MTRLADICARKELVDIAQAHPWAVDGILARAVAEGRALDGHFIKIYLELPVCLRKARIIEHDDDCRAVRPRHRVGAAPDEGPRRACRAYSSSTARRARSGTLLPFDLPEPFTDNRGGGIRKVQDRLLGERFKSDYFKPL